MLKYIVVFIAMTAVSCDSNPEPPDTFRGVCAELGSYFCQTADTCAIEPYAPCLQAYMQACCADNSLCNQTVDYIEDSEWSECVSELENMSCSSVESGIIPTACVQAISR